MLSVLSVVLPDFKGQAAMEADPEIRILENEIKKNSNSFFLQEALDEIFETCAETKVDNAEKRMLLFKGLSPLLGEELVERSLNLLDRWTITYYHTRNSIRNCQIVEWTCRRNSQATSYRIVPRTNYCKCNFFQSRVLLMDESEDLKDESEDLNVEPKNSKEKSKDLMEEPKASTSSLSSAPLRLTPVSYTCEHILGQRIHKVLMEPKIQIVTLQQYMIMLKSIYEDT